MLGTKNEKGEVMSIDEIKKLNVKDRIILMNDIWETLESESDTVESPSWHKDVLEQRLYKMKNNEAKYISLEELKSR
jgi:putative addiction module component (TIGR02574 family)